MLPGVIGSLQATEVIKVVLGLGEPLIGRVLVYDATAMRFHEMRLARDPSCAVCGASPTIRDVQASGLAVTSGHAMDGKGPAREAAAPVACASPSQTCA